MLTADDIAKYLRINVIRVYENLNLKPIAGGIPSFKMGKQKRVLKQDFIKWVNDQRTGSLG
ncbi:hypothetical protein BK127_30890 [Paenibacillus sp. FSL H7-0331]|nr:hypothetical protein BK127_30890 [Paenibacillus sp. FSL H7-0331]